MAMSASVLAAAIKATRPDPVNTSDPEKAKDYADACLTAMCEAIIAHIVNNAEIVPTQTENGEPGAPVEGDPIVAGTIQ